MDLLLYFINEHEERIFLCDADLLGVPVRVVVSPRNMKQGVVEIAARDKSFSEKAALDAAEETVQRIVNELLNK